ncbi:MAG: 5-oxoprolinase subunit PxpB [Desulfobacteraceae bacterium]|jgi:inhibitor of KinA
MSHVLEARITNTNHGIFIVSGLCMTHETPTYRVMGDQALLVELGDGISPEVHRRVLDLYISLVEHPVEGVVEAVPAYRSVLVIYDPLCVEMSVLQDRIEDRRVSAASTALSEKIPKEIPVLYGGRYGPDLDEVAAFHGLSPEEVVRLHTSLEFRVYMIGFIPGFPYMGELPETLATPRRETPRTSVARGSVGIAENQTGIYPMESPGGWQIIGRTPLSLFDAEKTPPSTLVLGDSVQFVSISEEEFRHWRP